MTGSFELIKNMNTSCILETIRQKRRISRAEIARSTGLTPATVSNITAELLDFGLVQEVERGASSGGRKPVLLSIRPRACFFAGVHISSDVLEVAFSDVEAKILRNEKCALKKGIPYSSVLSQASALIRAEAESSGIKRIAGVGVCVHGLVNSEKGISVFAPNLGWEDVHIGSWFEKEFGVPSVVENDVHAMTLAENWCGFARGVKDYVYLYIGPGIGGSIVVGNELYKGGGGFAGEFGHQTIVPDGPLCTCGNRGCLQALASETTVTQNFIARKNGKCLDYTYQDVLNDAKAFDPVAMEEVMKSARYIGVEVGNIINAFSPSLVVINGRISQLGDPVMKAIKSEAQSRSLKYACCNTKIVFSTLAEKASIQGAATCIIRQMFAHPRRFFTGGC